MSAPTRPDAEGGDGVEADAVDDSVDDASAVESDDDAPPAGAAPSGRRGRIAAVLAGTVGVVLVLFVVLLATRDPAANRKVDSPLLGRTAPLIEGETIEGQPFTSSTYFGRWLVVNFFATWCGPCVAEHPELTAFQRAHREMGDADVVSVVFDDDPEQVRAWFEENGGEWPVVDAGDRAITEWGVSGVPESYVVDPDGVVVAKLVGGVTAEGLDQVVAQAQAQRAARASATTEAGP